MSFLGRLLDRLTASLTPESATALLARRAETAAMKIRRFANGTN
jgi:hypothetical protein